MEQALSATASRMDSLKQSLNLIASNIANSQTPGYKRSVAAFGEVLREASQRGAGESESKWIALSKKHLDTSQGPIRRTGRPLDLAIRGEAFFVLETAQGRRYTRKGHLYLSRQGELTDAAGNLYLGEGGPLRVPAEPAQITVARNGQVLADGEPVGKLRLVKIAESSSLVSEGGSIFRCEGERPTAATESEVIQGAVEQSNVEPTGEMVSLIDVMRSYEACTRILKRMEELNKQLVRQ
jgi:flagellar basal-body rod protein FlgF